MTLLTTAVEVYHAALLANPKALAYASSRGLDGDTVRGFRLGFAAGRLKRYLAFRGWSDELAAFTIPHILQSQTCPPHQNEYTTNTKASQLSPSPRLWPRRCGQEL